MDIDRVRGTRELDMASGYVERLRAIRDSLETTADHIDERDYISEAAEERSAAYREAIDAIDQAIEALEGLD